MAVALESDLKPDGVTQGDLVRFLQNVRDAINEIKTVQAGNYLLGPAGLAMGSNKDDVANAAFTFSIGGKHYAKAAITTGTAPGTDSVPEDTFGAVAFDIGVNGTVDAVPATDNATGYATAALAVAGLPAPATDHARMGYVTATNSAAAFVFGTTLFDAANTTVAFTDATTLANSIAEPALTLNKG